MKQLYTFWSWIIKLIAFVFHTTPLLVCLRAAFLNIFLRNTFFSIHFWHPPKALLEAAAKHTLSSWCIQTKRWRGRQRLWKSAVKVARGGRRVFEELTLGLLQAPEGRCAENDWQGQSGVGGTRCDGHSEDSKWALKQCGSGSQSAGTERAVRDPRFFKTEEMVCWGHDTATLTWCGADGLFTGAGDRC